MNKSSVSWIDPEHLRGLRLRPDAAVPKPAERPAAPPPVTPEEPIRYTNPASTAARKPHEEPLQARFDKLKHDYDQLHASARAAEERERHLKEEALKEAGALRRRVEELEKSTGQAAQAAPLTSEAEGRIRAESAKEIKRLEAELKEARNRITIELPGLKNTLHETRERYEQKLAELDGRLNEERVKHAGDVCKFKETLEEQRRTAASRQEKLRLYKSRAEDAEERVRELNAELEEVRGGFDRRLQEMAGPGDGDADVEALRQELVLAKAELAQARSAQESVQRLTEEAERAKVRLTEVRAEATRLREALRSATHGTREQTTALAEKLSAAEREAAKGAS